MLLSTPQKPARTPLGERTPAQNNANVTGFGIRMVPYTPPKIDNTSSFLSSPGDENQVPQLPQISSPSPTKKPRRAFSRRKRNIVVDKDTAFRSHPVGRSSLFSSFSSLSSRKSSDASSLSVSGSTPKRQLSRRLSRRSSNKSRESANRPPTRRQNVVALHSDGKTFSLVASDPPNTSRIISASTITSSRQVSDVFSSNGHAFSSLSSLPSPPSSREGFSSHVEDAYSSPSSYWAYQPPKTKASQNYGQSSIGSAKTKTTKRMFQPFRDATETSTESNSAPLTSPTSAVLYSTTSSPPRFSSNPIPRSLQNKTSMQSVLSVSTFTESVNFKVHPHSSSPVLPEENSELALGLVSSNNSSVQESNYQILGRSSPVLPSSPLDFGLTFDSQLPEIPSSPVFGSDDNFIVHGRTPSASSVVLAPKFSRESLVVAPLYSRKKPSIESLVSYTRTRRRTRGNSLRQKISIQSINSTISEELIKAIFAVPSIPSIHQHIRQGSDDSWGVTLPSQTTQQYLLQNPRPLPPTSQNLPASSESSYCATSLLNPDPLYVRANGNRTWSSHLSTVLSEAEPESRSNSYIDPYPGDTTLSHGLAAISTNPTTTLYEPDVDSAKPTNSSLPTPKPTTSNTLPSSPYISENIISHLHSPQQQQQPLYLEPTRTVIPAPSTAVVLSQRAALQNQQRFSIRLVDETGDGLTELRVLNSKSSLSKLGKFLSNFSDLNMYTSSATLHRTGSNSSFTVPAWAKVYYSRERRLAMPSSDSMFSKFQEGAPASSTRGEGSAHSDHVAFALSSSHHHHRHHHSRSIPKAGLFTPEVPPQSYGGVDVEAMKRYPDTMEPSDSGEPRLGRYIRKQTSSIWSPHLFRDCRSDEYNFWEPPVLNWVSDGGVLGWKNIQIAAFVSGFLFPVTWIVASFLPLPRDPRLEKNAQSDVEDTQSECGSVGRAPIQKPVQIANRPLAYETARWWRNLNRIMSVVGVLVLAAIVTLVVLGVTHSL